MIYTTLNKIRACHPCESGWTKLLTHLNKTAPDDEPLGLDVILQSNGIDDALWSLCVIHEHHKTWRLLAVKFAREVQHLMKDERSVKVLNVCEAHAAGLATDKELSEARKSAYAAAAYAAYAADAAAAAAYAAADADARKAMKEKQKEIFLTMLNGV